MVSASLALAGLAVSSIMAQAQFRPPGQIPGQGPGGYYEPAQGMDSAGLLVRIDRLESQLRSLTGQIEQLQFQNRRLEEQVQRLQGGGGDSRPQPQRRGDLAGPTPIGPSTAARSGRNDAFDPDADPQAPGSPRVIGALPERGFGGGREGLPRGPIIDESEPNDGPIDLTSPNRGQGRLPSSGGGGLPGPITSAPLPAPSYPPPSQPQAQPPAGQVAAIPPVAGPRGEFDVAVATFKKGDFDQAESEFRGFVGRYPTGRLTPEATYYLGETYSRRNRHREAAEQFLKVSTDFPKSGSVPQSLYRLGQSLDKLGVKEQACAAWSTIPRQYPQASANIRAAADREYKRAQC